MLLNLYAKPKHWFEIIIILLVILVGFAAPLSAAPGGKLVLAFGDSLTAGYGLPVGQSVPAILEKQLNKSGIQVRIHNAGVSGETTAGGLARLAWVLDGLKIKPDLVILELGANDALQGLDPRETAANLDKMMQILTARRLPVLITGMLAPPNLGKAYAAAFNPIYGHLARTYKAAYYPFFLEGVAANPKLNQADGIHPNEAGVAVIVGKMTPVVRKLLATP